MIRRTSVRALLVPVDGSPAALRALEHAIRESATQETTVHIINVQPELEEYGMVPAYLTKEKCRELATKRAATVVRPALTRLNRSGIRHETHVAYGEAGPEIARAADRLRCSAIVMGTRGMGALRDLVLGSVATKVVHLAKKPVVLVK